MTARRYVDALLPRIERLATEQLDAIARAGELVAGAIAGGHRVWVAQTSHCLHGEATFRAGGLMAAHILEDVIAIQPGDVVLAGTPAGTAAVVVELAIAAQARGAKLIVLTQLAYELHPETIVEHPSGRRLHEFADVLIDLGGPVGDGELPLLDTGVQMFPSSGVTGMIAMWMIFADATSFLIERGMVPLIWQSILQPGAVERNTELLAEYHRSGIGYVPSAPD